MSDISKRLKALEDRTNSSESGAPVEGGPFRILRITGGLPGPINFAYAGLHRWEREAGEELDAFCERAACAAKAEGEPSVNVGGLPRGDELAQFNTAAGEFDFEAWWSTVAAYYPEVPPEETRGFARRSQGW